MLTRKTLGLCGDQVKPGGEKVKRRDGAFQMGKSSARVGRERMPQARGLHEQRRRSGRATARTGLAAARTRAEAQEVRSKRLGQALQNLSHQATECELHFSLKTSGSVECTFQNTLKTKKVTVMTTGCSSDRNIRKMGNR